MATVPDDATTLREALALLGDWETDWTALLGSPATPPSGLLVEPTHSPNERLRPQSSTAPAGPTEYRLRRDARRAKLTDLESQVGELQRLLEREHARVAQRQATANRASPLAQECEAIARRQKRQRVAADAENALLRDSVDTQRTLARRMIKLTQKALTLAELLKPAVPRDGGASLATFSGPITPIPQQIRQLDCRLDEASVVLSTGVFDANRGRDFQCVSFRDLGFDGLQVEFAISWVVPFGVDAVTQALWAHMTCTNHRARRTDHEFTHTSSDLLCSTFVSEPTAHDQPNCNLGQPISGTTHGQSAVRRYAATPDGARCVVTRIHARIEDDEGTHKGDMHSDGWFQVEPLAATKATKTTPLVSRIKWCRRVTGRPAGHETKTPVARATWVHSVVGGPLHRHWESNLLLNMQVIENALLHS